MFTVNKLALSLDKAKIIKFIASSIGYNGKYIEESANTKSLGL
jgi:hypothetical protein